MSAMSEAVKSRASDKVGKTLTEFKRGDLKSSSGNTVTDKKQALAIALSKRAK